MKFFLPFLFCLSLTLILPASPLEQKIGQMLMVGFYGTSASPDTQICRDIHRYHLGGVILFDRNPVDKTKPKNIESASQLKRLTSQLQACARDGKLLIAVDQEGGKVQRLKQQYGFYGRYPSASQLSGMTESEIIHSYRSMAEELAYVGINYNLAPVVDLDINPQNYVIHKLGRSYGAKPEAVAGYAEQFMQAMHTSGVLTSLKHFPGHGSSMGDTHKGFVDVTPYWQESELQPYKILASKADSVMVAHVFNKKLDPAYPASLSFKTITGKLRWHLGYHGVVITDDLQMGAIKQKYTFQETVRLAVSAGNDILLFGNQLDPQNTLEVQRLVKMIKAMVESGALKEERIDKAFRRIQKLKKRL